MSAAPATILVEYPAGDRVAARRIGGMSVLERTLREAARAGTLVAYVRGDTLPALPTLALEVKPLAAGTAAPDDAVSVPGNRVAGVEVSDDRSARAAMRALLQTCRRPYDGVGDRFVIRYASLALTRLLCHTPVAPNHVTLLNIAVGLSACVAATRGSRLGFLVAGALMFLQVVLDSCDGELARIRHRHSRSGMILDNMSDDVIDNGFIACLGFGLGGPWAWLGLAAALARAFTATLIYVDVAGQGKFGDVMAFHWWFDRDEGDLVERFNPGVTPMTVVRGLGRRDLYVLLWAVTCLVGLPAVAFGHAVVLGFGHGAMGVAHLFLRRR